MLLGALVEGPWHQKELNSDLGPCHRDFRREQFVGGYCVRRSAAVGQWGITKANSKKLYNVPRTKGFHIRIHISHVTGANCIKSLLTGTLKGSAARAALCSLLYSHDHTLSPKPPFAALDGWGRLGRAALRDFCATLIVRGVFHMAELLTRSALRFKDRIANFATVVPFCVFFTDVN